MDLKPRRSGLYGGTSRTHGAYPSARGGIAVLTCPITGLRMHVTDARWRDGAWVHPMAYDELGNEEVDDTRPNVDSRFIPPHSRREYKRGWR